MSAIERVLVVGAGIPGMVLATALRRAGRHPDIIEIHPDWDVLGVGISIQGPALRALRSIELIDECVREGFGYSQVVNCDLQGRVDGVVDLPPSQRSSLSFVRRNNATGASPDPRSGARRDWLSRALWFDGDLDR